MRTAEITKYKVYPDYKNSGVEWLGDVPAHWELKQLRHVMVCLDGRRVPLNSEQRGEMQGELPYWGANGVVDHLNGWIFNEPLVLLGEDGAPFFGRFRDVAFFVTGKVWVNNHIHVLRPTPTIDPAYLVHVLNVTDYTAYIEGTTRDKLTQDRMRAIPVLTLPLSEQRAIAAFLDRETARIDALIEKKRRQIELLHEKRAALISRAVTKGLDPNAPMKDSGIEWLGDVPEHWEVLAFKRLGEFQAGAGFPNDEQGSEDEELPFYKVSDMNLPGNEIFMTKHNNAVSRETALKLRAYVFPEETVVFAKVGAALLLNKRRILTRPSCIDNNMIGLIRKSCDLGWVYYWMCSLDLGELANPGAVPSINEGQICEIRVPLPPLSEQSAIAAFLNRETAWIDALVEKINLSIATLREYRAALISAAVTGKIDVCKEVTI